MLFSVSAVTRLAERFSSAMRDGLQDWCPNVSRGGAVEGQRETEVAKSMYI